MTTKKQLIKDQLYTQLNEICARWDISGGFTVLQHGETLFDGFFGYADRENHLPTEKNASYTLDCECNFFIKLGIFLLIDQNRLKLTDKLAKYIPEYPHSHNITIKQLIKSETGIPDFYYNKIMVDFDQDNDYKALDDVARINLERKAYHQNKNFSSVMSLIEEMPLEYPPGTKDLSDSESDTVFLGEIIRRITGQSLFDFLNQHLFKPLKMHAICEGSQSDTVSYTVLRHTHLVRLPLDYPVQGLISVTLHDMKKLLAALCAHGIFSESLWKTLTKQDKDGNGLLLHNANGYDCADASFLGSGFHCYIDYKTGVAFASLVNEEQKLKFQDGTWHYFRRDSREAITAAFTYPDNTRIVKANKSNFWDALNLKVAHGQEEFVLEAKSSIAMGLMYKTKQVYVQMEGNVCVGLLVLDINPKKDYFHIDIILIDQRFQGRGYGKHILKFAMETLKKAGAKELKIGVSRHNHGAKKIYMDAGFTPKSIYEEGMELYLRLAPEELSSPGELNGSHYVV